MTWVDTAPIDRADLGVTVYWLGMRYAPGGELPALRLAYVSGPGGPPDLRARLEYTIEEGNQPGGVALGIWSRADWEVWAAREASGDDYAALFQMYWNSPCAMREDLDLADGQAVIYASYWALADPDVTECPAGEPDRFLAHAFVGDAVITVNAPVSLMDNVGREGALDDPWWSIAGMRAVVTGLVARDPVPEPTPLPTPASTLADPLSLLLQQADLPGRYAFGDDGCSPDWQCLTAPTGLSTEGGSEALSDAFGLFRGANYQFEHAGISDTGTPDPTIEPPVIDSYVFICEPDTACSPEAILQQDVTLLDYFGHERTTRLDSGLSLGDETRVYEVDALVRGQIDTGVAVLWRRGPVVALLVVGGAGEQNLTLASDLARKQDGRIAQAVGNG